MTAKVEVFYVLEYPQGGSGYVAIDQDSGYPYEVMSVRRAKQWADKQEAMKYQSMFTSDRFVLKTVIATIGE